MDENRNTGRLPEKEEDLLQPPTLAEEILADELAMAAAGLTHPENAEVDRILEEVRDLTDTDSVPEPMFRDQEYTDTFGEGEDLERVFSDEAYMAAGEPQVPYAQEEHPEYTDDGMLPQEEPKPVRKGRPRRKKGYGLLGIPHILATVVWLAIVVVIGVSLGRVAWVCATDVLAFGREPKEIAFTVEDSDTIEDIALKLQEEGLIRYPQLFELYADITNAREDISSGTFTLNTIYDYNALVNNMTTYSSTREEVRVTIPEGYSCAQIFALLEENGVCSATSLEEYAAGGALGEYWFLENVERGESYCLEGFLFPDTYDFYKNDSAEHVLKKLLNNFDRRFTEEMIAGIDALNQRLGDMMRANGYGEDYIAENQMDIQKLVTVASLVEEETSGFEESFAISSVIYNRLTNQRDYPYLNIDAALLYVLGHKEALTVEDLQTDTPYNTYTHKGLIPGPISNPGMDSLSAALNPDDTNYHYYVLNPQTGEHKFSATKEENDAAVASFRG